jgi:hypothetical protein
VFDVALTVFASNGTSLGTARYVAVGTVPGPTVTKVTPAKGGAAGGTAVTISGLNLTGTTAVEFGATGATSFTNRTATSIIAVVPPGTPGIVDVTVTTPGGTSPVSLGDHYKYTPTVTAVSPNGGPAAGGTPVTVTGSGFALGTGTIFKFGAAKATGVSCPSSTSCTMIAPKHEAGTVDVTATVNKVASPKSPPGDTFTYS